MTETILGGGGGSARRFIPSQLRAAFFSRSERASPWLRLRVRDTGGDGRPRADTQKNSRWSDSKRPGNGEWGTFFYLISKMYELQRTPFLRAICAHQEPSAQRHHAALALHPLTIACVPLSRPLSPFSRFLLPPFGSGINITCGTSRGSFLHPALRSSPIFFRENV